MNALLRTGDRQRQSTGGNHAQLRLPMLSEAGTPALADDSILRHCDSMLDSIHLCIHLSHLPHEAICKRLGIDKGHWCRMMQGQAHFPPNKVQALMELAGNYAPLQYLAAACGFQLFKDAKAQRKAELLAELAKLEDAA